MTRLIKILLALCLLPLSIAWGQNTTITATVVDSDGTVWANAPYSLNFRVNPSQPNRDAYNINGVKLDPTQLQYSGTLSSLGVLSANVYQTSAISPTGALWTLTVCPLSSATACGTVYIGTAGSTEDVSSLINSAITAPRFPALAGAYGYADSEAQITIPVGATYWNVTLQGQRYWNGSTWVSGGLPTGVSCTGSGTSQICTFSGTVAASTASFGPITPTSPDAAQSTLVNYATAGGQAPTPAIGVINDMCPHVNPSTNHMAAGVCVSGAATNNCTALNAAGALHGKWYLPTSLQGSMGWIYSSCTVVQSVDSNVLTGGGGGIFGGDPIAGTTTIAVPAASSVDGIQQNCSVTTCRGNGATNLNIVAVTAAGAIGQSTGYAYHITGPAGHTGSRYDAFNCQLDHIYTIGFTTGLYSWGAAACTFSQGATQTYGSGPGTIIAGPGANSNSTRQWRAEGGNGASVAQQFGDSGSGYANGFFGEVGDSGGAAEFSWGTPTFSIKGFLNIKEVEAQTIPAIAGNNSWLWANYAGTAGHSNTTGPHIKMSGAGGLAWAQASPTGWIPMLATETITAGTPTTGAGTLAAGTYYYKVAGVNPVGASTLPSSEVSATLGSTGSITIPLTYGANVTGYPGVAIYRGTSSGAEAYLTTIWNATTYVADTGGYGTPSGSVPSVSTYYHAQVETMTNDQVIFYGPPAPIQTQNPTSYPTIAPALVYQDPNHEWVYGNRGCTEVTYGYSLTPAYVHRMECFFTPAKRNAGVSDVPPQWVYRKADATYALTPNLADPNGTGHVVLDTGATLHSPNTDGTATMLNVTVTGLCTGCTGPVTPQSTLIFGAVQGGIGVGKYISGITATGASSTTCILTFANGGTATLALTDTDVIAGSTAYTVTAPGSNILEGYTTATVSTGTATSCSGTPVLATNLQYSVQGTGSTVTVFTATVPVLAAGRCAAYTAVYERTGAYNGSQNAAWYLGGGSAMSAVSGATSATLQEIQTTIHICNNPGVQNAQQNTSDPTMVGPGAQFFPATTYFSALDFTTTQTLLFKVSFPSTDYYYPISLRQGLGQ
jgi:hypothetical protein